MEIIRPEAVVPNYEENIVLAISAVEAHRPFIVPSDHGTNFELKYTFYNRRLPSMPIVENNGIYTWVSFPIVETPF